jgi:hypothetical protein
MIIWGQSFQEYLLKPMKSQEVRVLKCEVRSVTCRESDVPGT